MDTSDVRMVLDFLNGVSTPEEIIDAIRASGSSGVGIAIAHNLLQRRTQLGKFDNIKQVINVSRVGVRILQKLVLAARMRTAL
jgi:transcriptional accessory protein Tex/SPT6